MSWWGGGVPHPVMVGEYPIQSWWGRADTPHHPDLAGVPPPPSRCGQGYLPPSRPGQGPPHPDIAEVPPPRHPDMAKVPPPHPRDGVPLPHHPDLAGVAPPTPDLGWGTPHPYLGWSNPPQTQVWTDTQTCVKTLASLQLQVRGQ